MHEYFSETSGSFRQATIQPTHIETISEICLFEQNLFRVKVVGVHYNLNLIGTTHLQQFPMLYFLVLPETTLPLPTIDYLIRPPAIYGFRPFLIRDFESGVLVVLQS